MPYSLNSLTHDLAAQHDGYCCACNGGLLGTRTVYVWLYGKMTLGYSECVSAWDATSARNYTKIGEHLQSLHGVRKDENDTDCMVHELECMTEFVLGTGCLHEIRNDENDTGCTMHELECMIEFSLGTGCLLGMMWTQAFRLTFSGCLHD